MTPSESALRIAELELDNVCLRMASNRDDNQVGKLISEYHRAKRRLETARTECAL